MKTYQIPVTDIQHLMSDRMMDTVNMSYRPEGDDPGNSLMYAPQSPKVR